MNRPYIICHMMMSVDGRIDCGMTVKIAGSEEYYEPLGALNVLTCLSGRISRISGFSAHFLDRMWKRTD